MLSLIQCADQVGLVAKIATEFSKRGLNILSLREHVEIGEGQFFMRVHSAPADDISALQQALQQVLPPQATVKVNPDPEKKIVVLVTREYHCLGDILVRNHFNTLGAKVQAVIGNHAVLEEVCNRFGIPFHLVSHENRSREDFESELENRIEQFSYDNLVLAKFMRILSPGFVSRRARRILNIHHSFLPAFTGAAPYKQAYSRGVKLIGATAHFVTDDLDEGPIIAQQIIPVTHTHSAEDMVRAGAEIEKAVLAKAMKLVFEDRVFVVGNRTVVFE